MIAKFATLCVGVTLLVGCSGGGKSSTAGCKPADISSHDARTIIVEGDPWSGYAPFRNERLLEGTAYTSRYVEQLCQDLRAVDVTTGRADIEVTTLDQVVLNRPEATVVGVIDQSEGADALALNTVDLPYLKSVDNVPQLIEAFRKKGKKPVLAYTGSSPSEMLLNELANTSEELHLGDFRLVSVDQSATAYKMLRDHRAELAVIWEPDTSAARAAGYTIALSSKDVPDSIVDVIVVSNKLIKRDPAAVQAVVRSFYTAMDHYLAHPDEFEQLIATDGKLETAAAKSVIAGIRLYGSRDAGVFMNDKVFPLDQPRVEQSVKAIASVLALSHPSVDVNGASIDGRYVYRLNG
jgi:OmpA-OmpF porin, OOP family